MIPRISLLLLISLVGAAGLLMAHERTALFNRNDPVWVKVPYKKIVYLRFWEQVLEPHTTIPERDLGIKIDDTANDTLILTGLSEKPKGMLYVKTVSGVVVHLHISDTGETNQLITVKDARTEAERAAHRVRQQTKLTDDERAVRQLWRAMWGFPHDPLVQVRDLHHVAKRDDYREIIITKHYETIGFYGYTQRVTNREPTPITLHPSTITVDCPLFSVGLDGHDPPVPPGGNPHVIPSGGSVLVHLTCKGARRATLR